MIHQDNETKRCKSCDTAIEKAAVSRYKDRIRKQVEAWRDEAFKDYKKFAEANNDILPRIRKDIMDRITAEVNAGTEATVAQKVLDLIDGDTS